jgi:hypothetical protein
MGKVHGSLARAGKVKSQTRTYTPFHCIEKQQQLTFGSQGKHTSICARTIVFSHLRPKHADMTAHAITIRTATQSTGTAITEWD